MNFVESFKQALESLKSNKLRSFLTMLGIIMGVFSIITIVAIGNAAQAYMNTQFEKLGANVIQITTKSRVLTSADWLTYDDLEIVKKAAPEIKNIHTTIDRIGEIRVGTNTKESIVYGWTSQSKYFRPMDLLEGRFINDVDVTTKANVAVVMESFARKYFNRTDIIGETILLRNTQGGGSTLKLKVVGVAKSAGDIFEGMFGEDFPTTVILPISTVQSFYNVKRLDSIEVSVVDKDQLKQIGERIVRALEFKHGNKDKYAARNSVEMQKSLSDVLGVVSSVLLVIAIITLIVGGIGIVNILLVSVTERIREIGIRKALGAQKKDIILQFLTESIIMTGISGLIGIFVGIISGSVISSLIKIPPVVDIPVIIFSFLGSIVLGIIFGVYPAKKAADLDPIECLRYE